MTSPQATTIEQSDFTMPEQQSLRQLRSRYREGPDIFTEEEMGRIRFLRWLYQSGRLAS